MKFLLVYLLFFISSANAYFIKKIDFINGVDIPKNYTSASACGDGCLDVPPGYKRELYSLEKEMVNDYEKPQIEISNSEACESRDGVSKDQDCLEKLSNKVCSSSNGESKKSDGNNVYCQRVSGYEQMESGREILVEDSAKRVIYEAQQLSIKQASEKRALSKKKISFGATMIEDYNIMRGENQLSTSDSLLMLNKFRDLLGLAQGGQIAAARNVLAAIEVDSFFTQQTKDAFLSKIDLFLATL